MSQAITAAKLRHQPPRGRFWESVVILHLRRTTIIALFSAVAIVAHLALRFGFRAALGIYQLRLLATFIFGGIPLNWLKKVDEFMHISRRMRAIALQSAVGGMLLSVGGMVFAAAGYLVPVAGRSRPGNYRCVCRS